MSEARQGKKWIKRSVPLEQLAAHDQWSVDEDPVRQEEIFDVSRISGRIFQQVGHEPLHRTLRWQITRNRQRAIHRSVTDKWSSQFTILVFIIFKQFTFLIKIFNKLI